MAHHFISEHLQLTAIGVIRMVKLFGWETNMSKKVEEKREEELRWIWKTSVRRFLNGYSACKTRR